jgi:hypothetical protein
MAFIICTIARLRTAWLRLRIDAYSRQLHSIWAQRENDFEAERLLHRQLCAARRKLRRLSKDRRTSDSINASSRPDKFRPTLVKGGDQRN